MPKKGTPYILDECTGLPEETGQPYRCSRHFVCPTRGGGSTALQNRPLKCGGYGSGPATAIIATEYILFCGKREVCASLSLVVKKLRCCCGQLAVLDEAWHSPYLAERNMVPFAKRRRSFSCRCCRMVFPGCFPAVVFVRWYSMAGVADRWQQCLPWDAQHS